MRVNNRWNIFLVLVFALVGMLLAGEANAVCPVCTVAVGACLSLSRYLGIDDIITSLWIGGFLVSVSIWTIDWLDRKNIKFFLRKILVIFFFYVISLWPLYWKGMIGQPLNKLWGIDKIILGVVVGSLVFMAAISLNNFLKQKNGGKVYFPFQKVALPVVTLAVFSAVFYFLTC